MRLKISGVRKGLIVVFTLLVVFLSLLFSSCQGILLTPLETGQKITGKFGDVILVLGGGLRPGVMLGFSTEERLELAVELYRQRPRTIIVSDGSLYPRSPAIPMIREYLTGNGIAEKKIILEGRSQNTYQNIRFGLDIIRKQGFKEVIACTSPYHQSRVELLMTRLKYPPFQIAFMEKSEIRKAGGIRQRLRNLRLMAREYLAILRLKIVRP